MSAIDVLKSIDFGKSVAELEAESLKQYFVETNNWKKLREGKVDVIYGPKGSGKSAIYSLISLYEADFFQENTVLRFAENPRGATAFSDLQTNPPESEPSFVNLWKLYILALIGEHFRKYGTQTQEGADVVRALEECGLLVVDDQLRVFLGKVKNYVKKYFNPETIEPKVEVDPYSGLPTGGGFKISFSEPNEVQAKAGIQSIDGILYKANKELEKSGFQIWFLLDRLDVAFSDNSELEENALRALFKAYLDLAGCRSIKLKIFLRSDIWRRITEKGFREATHVQNATIISWDETSILNLIIRRFLNNHAVLGYYNIDRDTILASVSEQRALFYRIFPEKVDSGKNPETLQWLIGRTRDSHNDSAPRDIINLINAAIDSQIHSLELGENLLEGEAILSRIALKEGLKTASKEKVEKYLFAEYPNLRKYFEFLSGEKTRQTLSSLAQGWAVDIQEAEKIGDRIAETGFWRKERKPDIEYWTEFIFRDGLGMSQGTADEA